MSGKSRGRYRSARSPRDDGARGAVESEEEGFRTKRVREKPTKLNPPYYEGPTIRPVLDYIHCLSLE